MFEGPCSGSCNFDANFCNFANSESADFPWGLSRGSLKISSGPLEDQGAWEHGAQAGGFAFIDSSYPRSSGDRAVLVQMDTVEFTDEENYCLVFWVSLFGSGLGSLRYQDKYC